MTLQEFKQQCEWREELREKWNSFVVSVLAFRGERLSLARARVDNPKTPASSAFQESAIAFARAKKELESVCSKAGVQVPKLKLESVCRLFYS